METFHGVGDDCAGIISLWQTTGMIKRGTISSTTVEFMEGIPNQDVMRYDSASVPVDAPYPGRGGAV